ncbi:NirD/YgiW/YdeI family stress tolerance protein [Acinetobacter terrestris]|uniref:NirD/YgiW/YdeI family stress tolerance protein n=1 Tax=Acinetobacter terrestris TaxID=2529843 RepID=UPI00103AFCB2|nr:NirD/YgiW/YdeI family stress tolerance protein [Acinetobacter terrestris]TCB65666.1 NirD/YgiW/YdeI family stress tolerance protein [Acinetobacter terrestris]
MNKILLALFVTGSMLSTASVWAGKSDQVIMTEAAQNMVTVAEAKKLPDETAVTLSGVIVRKTQKDHFELKDSSGKIGMEVDSDLWKPMGLKAGDKVKVIGEVDTNTGQAADIDVVQIGKMENQSDKWTWYNQH